jgi:hypothetical protein
MYFDEVEVVELGSAEDLIQDTFDVDNSEGTLPSRIKSLLTVYAADAE